MSASMNAAASATTKPSRRVSRRDGTLGLTLEREKADRLRDMAWRQRRTVASLLRELVAFSLEVQGIDLNAPETWPETPAAAETDRETTNATA